MDKPRFCFYVNPSQDTSLYGGYVPSVVTEDERGHAPCTGDPNKHQMPWVWGSDLRVAEQAAEDMNKRLGLTEHDVASIIASSMAKSFPRRRANV